MATTDQFSLRWNNFHSNLASGFHELLEATDLVDVTLAVEGQFLHAHKLVLSICSPYFKQMFKLNPCKHPIIILKDVAHEHLKDILEFMYLGEVNVLRENLPIFLRTAELLQVKGLSGDDTQSNSSTKSNDKLDMLDDALALEAQLDDEDIEEHQHQSPVPSHTSTTTTTTAATTATNKRSKSVTHSNSKKIKNEPASNKNQKVPKENNYDGERSVKMESPITTRNDSAQYDNNDELSMEFRQNNDSGIGYMNNVSNNSDVAAQEQDVIMFSVDERGHVYCPYCYKKFVNRYNLKVHIRDKHDSSTSNLDCVICKKTMRNKSCLRVHMYHHRKQEQMLEQAKQQGVQVNNLG